jgi:aldose 1-epimerase
MLTVTAASSAANYSAVKTSVDSIEVVRLTDRARNTEVSIVPSIGNLAYEMKVKGKNLFWFPYEKLSDFRDKPALCGNPFLGPWANRLDEDAFYANGKKYLLNAGLGNLMRDQNNRPIHGLLMFAKEWKVVAVRAGDYGAEVTSRLEFWRHPDLMAQFPFAHNLEMTYRLKDGVLEIVTAIQNLSDQPMPVAVGYHPYFRLQDAERDQWKVTMSAKDAVKLSPALFPTGEFEPARYTNPISLQGTELDNVFTHLVRGADGRAEFSVQGKSQKLSVIYGPKYDVAIVYAPAGKDFICFEPMAAITNAFNLAQKGAYKELQSIAPGGTWKESYWLKAEGF